MLSGNVTHKLLSYHQIKHMMEGAAQNHTRALCPTLRRFSEAVCLMSIWPRAKDTAHILQGSVRKIHAIERWEMTLKDGLDIKLSALVASDYLYSFKCLVSEHIRITWGQLIIFVPLPFYEIPVTWDLHLNVLLGVIHRTHMNQWHVFGIRLVLHLN